MKLFLKSFFLTLIAALILIGLVNRAYVSVGNYFGYCTRKSLKRVITDTGIRYKDFRGYRYTTEEWLDIAINSYLSVQEMDYAEIWKAEQLEERKLKKDWEFDIPKDMEKRFTLIAYIDKDEFLRANPGCCKLSWGVAGGDRFGFLERADDCGDGMFNFKHKVRYLDQQGTRKDVDSTNTYVTVGNCGYAGLRVYEGEVADRYDTPKSVSEKRQ